MESCKFFVGLITVFTIKASGNIQINFDVNNNNSHRNYLREIDWIKFSYILTAVSFKIIEVKANSEHWQQTDGNKRGHVEHSMDVITTMMCVVLSPNEMYL